MSRAHARQSRRGQERGANTPVSGPRLKPLESSADALPTIRNFVPWREMEKKLAERLAARAAAGELTGELPRLAPQEPASEDPSQEPVENSGIRRSLFDHEFDDLTYNVYTLADLDARQERAPRSAPVDIAPPPDPWSELRARRWPREWPPLKTVLSAGAVAFGIFALLTVVVLVVADLTDDLKPRKAVAADRSVPTAAPVPVAVVPAPVVAAAEPDITLELDDVAPPKPVRSTPAKRPAAKKKGR